MKEVLFDSCNLSCDYTGISRADKHIFLSLATRPFLTSKDNNLGIVIFHSSTTIPTLLLSAVACQQRHAMLQTH